MAEVETIRDGYQVRAPDGSLSAGPGSAAAAAWLDRLDDLVDDGDGYRLLFGSPDASGRIKPAYCASACVLVYAGGKTRFGVLGSALGVHRFVTTKPADDPVADTQRIAGAVLGYMTKMGVSSSIVEAMSETREIRWLSPKQALAMNLVTDPLGKP